MFNSIKTNATEEPPNMNVGKKVFLFFAILFLLLIMLFVCLWMMLNNANQLTQIQLRRFDSYMLAEELRRSSDDLTRMVRTYTVTGDPRFKQYFELIQAIRDGKEPRPDSYRNIFWDLISVDHSYQKGKGRRVPITTLMKELNFTEVELAILAEAKEFSDQLIYSNEIQAMNAMEGLILGEDGKYKNTGEPNLELARQLVHGREYHHSKALIMEKMNTFFNLIDLRTLNEVKLFESAQKRTLIFAIILVILLAAVCILGYYYFTRAIVSSLQGTQEK